jgi:uncharacterized protein YceK
MKSLYDNTVFMIQSSGCGQVMSGDEQVKGNNDTKEEVWFDSKEEAEQ